MLVSIVIPVYDEVETLPFLLKELRRVLATANFESELIFVNDGSRDKTFATLAEAAAVDPSVKVLGFSRNFGHQAAITAGLDFASGDAVVVMDADLQDPPEMIPQMVDLYRSGYDVVSAQRVTRAGDGRVKRVTAAMFYWIIRQLSPGTSIVPEVGDFRLFSRAAVVAIRGFREQHRFMRGLVAWLGLKEVILPIHRHARVAGITKYTFLKMLRFAWVAITSFSPLPLRLSLAMGVLFAAVGFIYFGYVIFAALVQKATIPGWASLIGLLVAFFGVTLVAIGLVGEYVARIYEEIKGRPLYVVAEAINLPQRDSEISRIVMLPARPANAAARHGLRARTRGA